jgi:hypothetical protein
MALASSHFLGSDSDCDRGSYCVRVTVTSGVAGVGVTPSASHSKSTTCPLSPSIPRSSPLTVASTPPALPQRKAMLSRPRQVRVVPSSREPAKTSSPSTITRSQEYSTILSSTSTPVETLGVGVPVGARVGVLVGTLVRVEVGEMMTAAVGMAVDVAVGISVGVAVGMVVGVVVGIVVSVAVGVAGGSMISLEGVAVGDGVAVATARHDDNQTLAVGAR